MPTTAAIRISESGNSKPAGGVPLVASMREIADLAVAREYINYIDCSTKEKLMQGKEESGPGWTAEAANKAEVMRTSWIVTPIFSDTQALFSKYLHHHPYFVKRRKADGEKLARVRGNKEIISRRIWLQSCRLAHDFGDLNAEAELEV
jgi:hypothetical protein